MPKDKEGNELTWKEYGSRWKKGIEGITPLQQKKMQMNSMYIIVLGLVCGLSITLFNFKVLWWLSIVLCGGLFNTLVQLIAVYQNKQALERLEQFKVDPKEVFNEK